MQLAHHRGWPVDEDRLAEDRLLLHHAEVTAVAGEIAVVAQNEIAVVRDSDFARRALVSKLRRNVGLRQLLAIHHHRPAHDLDAVARHAYDALDVILAAVARIAEDHHIAPLDGPQAVCIFVDEDALLVGQAWHHAGPLHLYRLVEEDDDEDGDAQRDHRLA